MTDDTDDQMRFITTNIFTFLYDKVCVLAPSAILDSYIDKGNHSYCVSLVIYTHITRTNRSGMPVSLDSWLISYSLP